ncbi:hypothetical protein [Vagococcus fluvialis]|uniref:hypothetical protein n=1 Tax=Vagococcus fluvialis TaxID=2738 RepID=UPI0037AF7E41
MGKNKNKKAQERKKELKKMQKILDEQKQVQQTKQQKKLEVNNEVPQTKLNENQISLSQRVIFIFVYILFPTLVVLCSYFYVRNFFINHLVNMKIKDHYIKNSEYAINNVITPFFTTIVLILSLLATYFFITRYISFKFKREKYFNFAKKTLKFIEIFILLLGLVTMVYTKSEEFPYTDTKSYNEYIKKQDEYLYITHTIYDEDGNEVANSEENGLEGEPSINSLGVNAKETDKFYRILLPLSQFIFSISKYFSVVVTIAGAIIFPLRSYIGKNENIIVKK